MMTLSTWKWRPNALINLTRTNACGFRRHPWSGGSSDSSRRLAPEQGSGPDCRPPAAGFAGQGRDYDIGGQHERSPSVDSFLAGRRFAAHFKNRIRPPTQLLTHDSVCGSVCGKVSETAENRQKREKISKALILPFQIVIAI
jgi:hypothetical protein